MTTAAGGPGGPVIPPISSYPWSSTEWMTRAACQGCPVDLFFPEGDAAEVRRRTARAKQVCAGCPVRSACLRWARRTGQRAGIWGGLAPHER